MAGAWGRQMHPNLAAVGIQLRLLAILAGIMVCFLSNGMHGMVTMVIEADQKEVWMEASRAVQEETLLSSGTQWRFCNKFWI